MASVNRLGILVVIITITIVAALYGAWQGIKRVIALNNPTPSVQPSSSPTPSPSPAPTGTFPSGLTQELIKNGLYTSKYLATLPKDLPKDQVLDKTRIEAFINENKGELLPTIDDSQIKTTTASGKDAIKNYLDAISSSANNDIKSITSEEIDTAYKTYYADPQHSTALSDIQTILEHNLSTLKNTAVPAEVAPIHKKLLAATQALINNVMLLQVAPKDLVGGLIGAKNIESLGPVFASIAQDITTLQQKYGL